MSTFITTAAYTRADEIDVVQFTTSLPQDQFAEFMAAVDRKGKANDVLAGNITKSRELFPDDSQNERLELKISRSGIEIDLDSNYHEDTLFRMSTEQAKELYESLKVLFDEQ